ncbi:MAG: fibronectin type III-like domain-contianing protein [Gemmatimonadales bacterium]
MGSGDGYAPGETRTVRLAVPAIDLAYYDAGNGWIVEPGEYEVIVGRHSSMRRRCGRDLR